MGSRHVMVRGTTLQMSAGGASSTIDYTSCTAPITGSSRRTHSHNQNRHTIAVIGSTERLEEMPSGGGAAHHHDQGLVTL